MFVIQELVLIELGINRDSMTLEFPYPVLVTLYDNRIDNNTQDNIWVYARDMTTYVALVSSQTETGDDSGKTVVDIQNAASTNGDIIRMYIPGYSMEEFILDTSTTYRGVDLYYNYNVVGDISIDASGDDIQDKYIIPEKLFSQSMYLRTYY